MLNFAAEEKQNFPRDPGFCCLLYEFCKQDCLHGFVCQLEDNPLVFPVQVIKGKRRCVSCNLETEFLHYDNKGYNTKQVLGP